MRALVDLSGQTFGELTVIRYQMVGFNAIRWVCLCSCGNYRTVHGCYLLNGHTKSCGCRKGKTGQLEDITGMKFNMLTALHIGKRINKKTWWRCQCECAEFTDVLISNLKNGSVKSCGCLGAGNLDKHRFKHGFKGTRLYETWDNMKGRCYRPSMDGYKSYGGKGIKICEEWLRNPSSFFKWAIESGYDDNLTIERNDSAKNYCPENCRWIPQPEQSRNRECALGIEKASEIKIRLKQGESATVIAKEYNVHPSTIGYIKSGKAYPYI